eukprot:Rmarinus@m.16261
MVLLIDLTKLLTHRAFFRRLKEDIHNPNSALRQRVRIKNRFALALVGSVYVVGPVLFGYLLLQYVTPAEEVAKYLVDREEKFRRTEEYRKQTEDSVEVK